MKVAHLESTTIWRLESRQNPHAGKAALRSAAFPGCGLAELSSSATGARLPRTLVVVSRCALLKGAPTKARAISGGRTLVRSTDQRARTGRGPQQGVDRLGQAGTNFPHQIL